MGRPKGGTNRRWAAEDKLQIIQEYQASNMGTRAFSKQKGISDGMFRLWIKKYCANGKGLRFYSNVFVDHDYNLPMLIHNLGETDLKISYELHGTVFHIKKEETKHIIPYIPEGTNKEERINKT